MSEAQEESQEDVGGAGEGSQPPSTVTGRNFTDNRPPTDGEHVAGRTRQSGGGVAISREDAAGGEVAPPTEFRRGSREPPRTSSQKASVWSRGHPEFRAGVDRMDVHEASRVARCFGNWTKRVGGGDITVVGKRCFGNASVLSASINIEQHGHVKVRSLHQWRPVLSRYGMRGVRVGEASNPGPVTTRQCESDSGHTSGQFWD